MHLLAVLGEVVDVPLIKVHGRVVRDVLSLEEPVELHDLVPSFMSPALVELMRPTAELTPSPPRR